MFKNEQKSFEMFFYHHNNWCRQDTHKETSRYFATQNSREYHKIFGIFQWEYTRRRASLLAYKTLPGNKTLFYPLCKVELTKILNKDGTLSEQITKQNGVPFSFFQIISWSIQILNGLEFLNEKEPIVVHRDLKPE